MLAEDGEIDTRAEMYENPIRDKTRRDASTIAAYNRNDDAVLGRRPGSFIVPVPELLDPEEDYNDHKAAKFARQHPARERTDFGDTIDLGWYAEALEEGEVEPTFAS